MLTPYQYASNSPIENLDIDGLESITYKIFYDNDGIRIDTKVVKHEIIGPKGSGTLTEVYYLSEVSNNLFDLEFGTQYEYMKQKEYYKPSRFLPKDINELSKQEIGNQFINYISYNSEKGEDKSKLDIRHAFGFYNKIYKKDIVEGGMFSKVNRIENFKIKVADENNETRTISFEIAFQTLTNATTKKESDPIFTEFQSKPYEDDIKFGDKYKFMLRFPEQRDSGSTSIYMKFDSNKDRTDFKNTFLKKKNE